MTTAVDLCCSTSSPRGVPRCGVAIVLIVMPSCSEFNGVAQHHMGGLTAEEEDQVMETSTQEAMEAVEETTLASAKPAGTKPNASQAGSQRHRKKGGGFACCGGNPDKAHGMIRPHRISHARRTPLCRLC